MVGDSFNFDDGEADAPPNPIPGFAPAVGETTDAGTAGIAAGAKAPAKPFCWKCAIVAVIVLALVYWFVLRKKG